MTIDTNFFKRVMGHFLTGVTVVTTCSQGQIGGLTVSSFCSLSLDPPLILVCIDLTSSTLPLLRESKAFAVNILTSQQEYLSSGFATNTPERFEHFCYAPYHAAATGAPILDDSLAFIDARMVAEYPGGDHVILIGEVAALGAGTQTSFVTEADEAGSSQAEARQGGLKQQEEEQPLAYYKAQYRRLASHYHKPSLPHQISDDTLERNVS